MFVNATKHVYIPEYQNLDIYNIELATDEETYFDVNINIKKGLDIISAATYECTNIKTAKSLARILAKQYETDYVEFVE